MTAETKIAPTPAQIDDLCLKFDSAKIESDRASQNLSTAKGELLAKIQDFGYTPQNAEKTVRLEGVLYIANATTPSTVEINEAAVIELQSELSRIKKPRVFTELFQRKVKHSLKKNAASTLKVTIGNLPDETQAHLLGIFGRCFAVDTKTPSVSVELAAALRKKEAEAAEKAEKKALRETNKAAKASKPKAAKGGK